jgi:hypothetical protein
MLFSLLKNLLELRIYGGDYRNCLMGVSKTAICFADVKIATEFQVRWIVSGANWKKLCDFFLHHFINMYGIRTSSHHERDVPQHLYLRVPLITPVFLSINNAAISNPILVLR